jgi:formylglycine-generating enzyme required for sulfatase activity/tRNA A-37 threonylcarbamoyl transferase component Bud32
MIAVICPGCHRKLSVKDAFAGKKGSCPHCKERIKVPAASGEKTSPSISDEQATVGGVRRASSDDATLPPPESSPSLLATAGERLDFLAPPQDPGELGRLGAYRVLKVLGAGGMGLVLQGEDPMLKRAVALKVMRPELAAGKDARERFLREAQATAAIEHPHIIHVYQVAEDRGVPFLAMPFLKGEPLDARLKRQPRLPVEEVISLGKQIAEGLAAAHKKGLIHRDIKPGNIWLEPHEGERGSGPTNWVKILDFGLARALTGEDVNLTKTGMILGTPAYMAPEQARGEKVDGRCDLFSLGAVLYRMLTGEMPFKGSDTISILMALATEEPQPPRELNANIPPALADLVMQLLSKDPTGRPASAREVADRLGMLVGGRTEVSAPGFPLAGWRGSKGRPRWLLPVVGATALLGLIVAVLFAFFRLSGRKVIDEQLGPVSLAAVGDPEGTIVNSLGMKLVPIQPGSFWMGSPRTEADHKPDEQEHEVHITRPFYVGMHKVTVGQYTAFVMDSGHITDSQRSEKGSFRRLPDGKWQVDPGTNWRNLGFEQTDEHPVVCVSINDATAFCLWLSAKEGKHYTLPTEAQWEYCCRAGSRKAFSFGDDEGELGQFAWFADNSGRATHPVGQKKPNAWGLYDVHGNAYERCVDVYDKEYYQNSPREDPMRFFSAPARTMRGGSWSQLARGCSSANRKGNLVSAGSSTDVGFRVVVLPGSLVANTVGMKLRSISPGRFTMGSSLREPNRQKDEPQHDIAITRPFWIGTHEVTVGQFKTFVQETQYKTDAEKDGRGSQRSLGSKKWQTDPTITWRTPGFEQTDEHPVVCVSWNDATAFCDWLSKKESKPYTLPTEAQWEFCCRAGARSRFHFGGDFKLADRFAWYAGNAASHTHPVGQKKPNNWLLHDMHGNAWEWCSDWYADYPKGPVTDPQGLTEGNLRVTRGGGFTAMADTGRSASRGKLAPSLSRTNIGFRVVLLPEPVLTNSIGMKLALMPVGSIKMGSPINERGRGRDEDEHDVAVTRPFYLGVSKVTVREFKAFVEATGYLTEAEKTREGAARPFPDGKWRLDPKTNWRNPGFAQTDDHPVVGVSWKDAKAFCDWLSKKEGKRYRLPTEAEWEFACRAGTRGRFFFGNDAKLLDEYAWYFPNSNKTTHPVGQKKPNPRGLFDVHGNAFEMVMDRYDPDYYKRSPKDDPPGPLEGNRAVLRGGGFNSRPDLCRSAKRFSAAYPGGRTVEQSFRVMLVW